MNFLDVSGEENLALRKISRRHSRIWMVNAILSMEILTWFWIHSTLVIHSFIGSKKETYSSVILGPSYGLELILNVEQYEYMAGPSKTAGIKVIIHNQTEVIAIEDRGIDVPPGFQASVGVQVIKVRNKTKQCFLIVANMGRLISFQVSGSSPGKGCGDAKLRYYAGYDYTNQACDKECESDYVEEMCGCHRTQIPRDPAIPESRHFEHTVTIHIL